MPPARPHPLFLVGLVLLTCLPTIAVLDVVALRWDGPVGADLSTYLGAAHAVLEGIDPREPGVIAAHAPGPTGGGWVYPFAWLGPFALLGLVPAAAVGRVWLVAQLGSLGLLMAATAWTLRARRWRAIALPALALVAMEPALRNAIHQGNAAPMEVAAVGLGMLGLAAAQPSGAWLAGLGASLKLAPLPLVGLAAATRGRRALFAALLPVLVLGLVELLSGRPLHFLHELTQDDLRGPVAPSLLAACRDLADGLGVSGGWITYLGLAAAVLLLTARARPLEPERWALPWLAWLLVLPRVSAYSWLHAVVPLALAWSRPRAAMPGLAAAVWCLHAEPAYGPLLVVGVTWAACLLPAGSDMPDAGRRDEPRPAQPPQHATTSG